MKFMADDGKVFDTAVECEKYEKRCNTVNTDIFFLKIDGTALIRTVDPLHADNVVIKKEIDLELLEELFGSYCDGLDEGCGIYYWDADKEKWVKIYHRICELEEEIDEIRDTIDRYERLEKQIKARFLN